MNSNLVNDSMSLGKGRVVCNMKMRKKLPAKLNWHKLKRVSRVKNQRKCGSCYIFSAMGALESQFLLANPGYKIGFSEQAVLNCKVSGCNGGWMSTVWDYIIANGVTNEMFAPYIGKVSSSFSKSII